MKTWPRTSPPRDDVGATALVPPLYIGQMSLGTYHRNSVVMSPGGEIDHFEIQFQSRLLHVHFNITKKVPSVQQIDRH